MMRRRDFISLLGAAAATTWPLVARAQQAAMPVIGFISSRSPSESEPDIAGFRQGSSRIYRTLERRHRVSLGGKSL
jgi:putative ABC transport system substrate-binding protein